MLLKYFYDEKLAQASYLVGCPGAGTALVIDAGRDIAPYLEAAEKEGLQITHVTETHIHADYVSGSRELAAQTGATLYLSDMGDADWKYQFVDENTVLVKDGDNWMVGAVRVDVIATPGHTPEHIIFQITDTAGASGAMGLFTGDCLFVGAIGRPDLLEKAAGIAGTMEVGARQQFHNMQKLLDMPDYLQVWPGHGAGSACGKSLGALPSTTLGYEKRFNPAFGFEDEDTFVEWLLDRQPEPPFYFAQMKKVNKIGPALLGHLGVPEQLRPEALSELLGKGELVIDTRRQEAFADGYVSGVVSIPGESEFNTYVGWYHDYAKLVYLITPPEELNTILRMLYAIGVDNIGGYFDPATLSNQQQLTQMCADELAQKRDSVQIVDVRNWTEHEESRIPGAVHIPMGYLPQQLERLATDKPIVLHCTSGVRSHIATTVLQKHGLSNVVNLIGGIETWEEAGYSVERQQPAQA